MASLLYTKVNNEWISIPVLQGPKGPPPIRTIDYWTMEDKEDIIARVLSLRTLEDPQIQLDNTTLVIEPVDNAVFYDIYINNTFITTSVETKVNLSSALWSLETALVSVIARAPMYLPSSTSAAADYERTLIVRIEQNEQGGLTYHIVANQYDEIENEEDGITYRI